MDSFRSVNTVMVLVKVQGSQNRRRREYEEGTYRKDEGREGSVGSEG